MEEERGKCDHYHHYHHEGLRARLETMVGQEVVVAVGYPILGSTLACGELAEVRGDFIVVNIVVADNAVRLHIPIHTIRYIAPMSCALLPSGI